MDPNENVNAQWLKVYEIRDAAVDGDRERGGRMLDDLAELVDAYGDWLSAGGFRATEDAPGIEHVATASAGLVVTR